MATTRMPQDRSPEASLALLRDPYGFVGERCRRFDSDVFEARIRLRKTICMQGREAARVFYDPGRFLRAGAPPARIQKTLFGRGGVQGLDGQAHRHRKAMFLGLMTPEEIDRLAALSADAWRAAAGRWRARHRTELYREAREIAFRPERFLAQDPDAFALVPQGGGDHAANHRCPGEWPTQALMRVATDFLARRLRYELPEQNLELDRSRLPALPRSRILIRGVVLA